MSQGILYSCVAHQTRVLSEHSMRSGNFKEIVFRLLSSVPESPDSQTSYSFQGYYFHFKVANKLTYLCLAEENFGRQIPFMFLEKISELFDVIQYNDKKVTAFDSVLKSNMDKFSKTKLVIPKTQAIQEDLNEVKGIMIKNIEGLMKRGEKLEILEEKTIELETEATQLKGNATQVKGHIQKWHRLRLILCAAGFLVLLGVLAMVIVYFVCGGLSNCGKAPTLAPTAAPSLAPGQTLAPGTTSAPSTQAPTITMAPTV